jgi:hypothetical protein
VPEKKLSVKSSPFQWSNIFGIDRKKKSVGLIFHPLEDVDKKKRKKRCGTEPCDEEDYSKLRSAECKFNKFLFSFRQMRKIMKMKITVARRSDHVKRNLTQWIRN